MRQTRIGSARVGRLIGSEYSNKTDDVLRSFLKNRMHRLLRGRVVRDRRRQPRKKEEREAIESERERAGEFSQKSLSHLLGFSADLVPRYRDYDEATASLSSSPYPVFPYPLRPSRVSPSMFLPSSSRPFVLSPSIIFTRIPALIIGGSSRRGERESGKESERE